MDSLQRQCRNHELYPKYLDPQSKTLNEYFERLEARSDSLFCEPEEALLELLDLKVGEQDFTLREGETLEEVQELCTFASSAVNNSSSCEPLRCRFLFLYGANSRSSLYVTRDMVSYILSYHQVQPWFLDFLFPFGKQEVPMDFRFSSFRHTEHFTQRSTTLMLPELGRSGQGYHLCYNLKSVERSDNNPNRPWSVRQTVVYHFFDTGTGQTFWIILKGNDSMRNELEQTVQQLQWQDQTRGPGLKCPFAASIKVHLEVCEWSRQNWRWYINDLEAQVDQLTEHGVTFNIFGAKDILPSLAPGSGSSGYYQYPKLFQFSDLQQAQHVEEKANQALLTLKSDVNNINALKAHYTSISNIDGNRWMIETGLQEFYAKLDEISSELATHQSSLEALIRLVTDRKQLLFGILEYENMLATRTFATKAQNSAEEMEKLTKQTKRETVSMKVITLVTMFFLPATFISTLMSTDIIRWETRDDGRFQKSVSQGAINFFLALTLPLTFMTFVTWGLVYAFILLKERKAVQSSAGSSGGNMSQLLPRMSWPINGN